MYEHEKKTLKMSEVRQKVRSWDVNGKDYIQCITSELDEEQRNFLINEYNAFEVPFKDGTKTRFMLPNYVELVYDLN